MFTHIKYNRKVSHEYYSTLLIITLKFKTTLLNNQCLFLINDSFSQGQFSRDGSLIQYHSFSYEWIPFHDKCTLLCYSCIILLEYITSLPIKTTNVCLNDQVNLSINNLLNSYDFIIYTYLNNTMISIHIYEIKFPEEIWYFPTPISKFFHFMQHMGKIQKGFKIFLKQT